MNDGFGWSFYGFFVMAALWCVVFNVWALRKNAQERRVAAMAARGSDPAEDRSPGAGDEASAAHDEAPGAGGDRT